MNVRTLGPAEPSLKPTIYAVLAAHALLMVLLTTQIFTATELPKRKAIVVQSVVLSPPKQAAALKSVPVSMPAAPPKVVVPPKAVEAPPTPAVEKVAEPIVEEEPEPQVEPEPEKPAAKETPAKKVETKAEKPKAEKPKTEKAKPEKAKTESTKPKEKKDTKDKKDSKDTKESKDKKTKTATESKPAKKSPSKEALAALAKAQENLSKVSHKTPAVSKGALASVALPATPTLAGLSSIQASGSDGQALPASEIGYQDELVVRLRMLLTLPDIGDVKVKLTLERSGKVVKALVTRSDSDENRRYVEKTLPTLKLPAFGKYFGADKERTFQLVLSNDL